MLYLVVMRVCLTGKENKLVRGGWGGLVIEGGGGGGEGTVVGRAERRRVEFSSQDCAVGR